jgi:hypothetical protein
MGRGLLQAHLNAFDEAGAGIADRRREGYGKQYGYSDAIKGAYGIFFFQHPSMLEYQERLKRKKERCNAETILKVRKIPNANHLTRLLDTMQPGDFGEVFDEGLNMVEKYLIALDGVWFYQSANISCGHCLHHKTGDGEELYYHDMAAAVVVKARKRRYCRLIQSSYGTKMGKKNRIVSGMRRKDGLKTMRTGINGLTRYC